MQTNAPNPLFEDASQPAPHDTGQQFTQHSTTIRPLSAEDDIREAANAVVPRVPLGEDETTASSATTTSPVYGSDGEARHAASDLDSLTAEDIRDEQF